MTTAFLSQAPCFSDSGSSPPRSRRRRASAASHRRRTALCFLSALKPVDLSVSNHGSIYLLSYGTERGRLWLHEHIDVEHSQTLGTSIVVEARYIVDIVRGALDAGLVVR